MNLLADSPNLRQRSGLTDKPPQFTALQKLSDRNQVLAIARKIVAEIGQAATVQTSSELPAMDDTGTDNRQRLFPHPSRRQGAQSG